MRKSGNLWLAMIAALILVCVMAIAGCGKQQAGAGSGSEQSAQSALEHVLSLLILRRHRKELNRQQRKPGMRQGLFL